MAVEAVAKYLKRAFPSLQKWAFDAAGWNQYGLHKDDLLYEDEDVTEALRRLPPHLVEERNFRLIRASQLDCQKKLLPKEQWTKFEEDIEYLSPYVDEVKRERAEREQWDLE
ncbi:Cytochrome b-c1 complex subunit 7 [Melipona quadrifasciata]|uniref:Cytochrome b-c1 complex subunit 7 n=1 Tax=Melipona quadrifasciata TaxID=166423 RepID=A0A0M9A6C1_9HYME|nr:Cytochrome b-c1 complex subunit 7 [Melipona quadrifasciata]